MGAAVELNREASARSEHTRARSATVQDQVSGRAAVEQARVVEADADKGRASAGLGVGTGVAEVGLGAAEVIADVVVSGVLVEPGAAVVDGRASAGLNQALIAARCIGPGGGAGGVQHAAAVQLTGVDAADRQRVAEAGRAGARHRAARPGGRAADVHRARAAQRPAVHRERIESRHAV